MAGEKEETILIKKGSMVNRDPGSENDDALILEKDVEATVVEKGEEADKVVIPALGPDETFFHHHPACGKK